MDRFCLSYGPSLYDSSQKGSRSWVWRADKRSPSKYKLLKSIEWKSACSLSNGHTLRQLRQNLLPVGDLNIFWQILGEINMTEVCERKKIIHSSNVLQPVVHKPVMDQNTNMGWAALNAHEWHAREIPGATQLVKLSKRKFIVTSCCSYCCSLRCW